MSKLNLHNRNLTTLERIKFPDDLIELDIANNQLTSLQGCPPNLQILYCSYNQLTSLQYCSPNLQMLYCSHNQLTSLQYCPPNLQMLYCSHNQLTSLQYCSPNLQELYCGYNQITSLQYCPPNIKQLYYYRNPLNKEYQSKSINEIHHINQIKHFQLGLTKINNIILNHKASLIQRCWSAYWYKPNQNNESKIGLYYYQQYMKEINI